MLISDVLKTKGEVVFTASPSDTVGAVAAMLGIVAERDVVRVVAEDGGGGLARPISACMTRDVVFAEPCETVDALLERMTDRRFRHVAVQSHGRLVGIVSIGDLVKSKIAETVAEAEGLRAYIHAA